MCDISNVTAVKHYHRAPKKPVAAGPHADLRAPLSVGPLLTLLEQGEELVLPTPVPPEPAPAMAPVAMPSSAAAASSRGYTKSF